ncbi:MAG: IS66 family insertion sequence element accessory protein TnpB [Petrimonas sp.]|nr:IS66 family insertion sequence element accessory protein TnpB [Petrimonas sp.]
MKPISKEEFIMILDRQEKSGLSIKDFCENESYTRSSFYYWKSKYGLTRPYNNHVNDTQAGKLAPININLPVKGAASSSPMTRGDRGEITIKLPSGVQVSFKGSAQSGMAMSLLEQILSCHVLP